MVQGLLQAGASKSLDKEMDDRSPIALALKNKDLKMTSLLVSCECDQVVVFYGRSRS